MPSTLQRNGPTPVIVKHGGQKTTKESEAIEDCDPIFAAAKAGNVDDIRDLLSDDPGRLDMRCAECHGITPIMAAAIANKQEAVEFLSTAGADVTLRDANSYTILKLVLDQGESHAGVAEWIVAHHPELIVTDPRLPAGKDWLRAQFAMMAAHIEEEASKPPKEVLEYLLDGYPAKLPADTGRTVSEVYWEHILLRYIGDIPLDIARNYSKDLKMAFVGTFDRILYKHEGIQESARLLNSVLPTTQYDIIGTHVVPQQGWVTERWEYHDKIHNLQVLDGIDTFLIDANAGKIEVMLINYNVYKMEWVDDPEKGKPGPGKICPPSAKA
ncbi:uncharacterized protein BP01DRAFT_176339 [Aspergillus saccharolyticus JOP 1030-1]|uniref:Uncharacterized protein n=1 Tax=Aspergillus saccharolyticus JOP 1030-1 TaxID=1450539 RepID=A0A319A8U7_9EURO|nr:hypothetical protein BP01DRAFT_176339 [Aspergillus saccharolyticus JOP 1030-1]PYH48108.1 hypothetical protein BP01DRAFT_176339 [Aspergillus saccharolyticus JOP 1030-1]